MNPDQIWQNVLGQLRVEMPRASFDTWLRDTHVESLKEDVLIVAARNADARDWLESRLTSTIQRLLIGILSKSITVQFVTRKYSEEEQAPDEKDEQEVSIEAVQWLDYERVVQPHKQVVVKGYLRRLGMEIGAKAVWLYIGFHQAAWRVYSKGKDASPALHSKDVMQFSGLSFGAFWRSLRNMDIQSGLVGLVQRLDPPHKRSYHRGRDGRPHRIPIRYKVCMTPRLTKADASAIHSRLKILLARDISMLMALQQLLAVEDVMELLSPTATEPANVQLNTVMDMVQLEAGEAYTLEMDRLAQDLHRRIICSLGDIHITHHFITKTIKQFNLTPAQAWLVTVARDMAYINSRTGERRDIVTFRNGYREMAELAGSDRYKTVQAWLNKGWTSQQRGGDLTRFLTEVDQQDTRNYSDLRVGNMPRSFRVLLDEPLDANDSKSAGAYGTNRVDASGRNNRTQMAAMADATGSNMLDANGSDLNSLKHFINTDKDNTSITRHNETSAGRAPQYWMLETLLQQNDVHPKAQRELLKSRASVQAFVSWVLYVASPQSGSLSDPLGYAISRLKENPSQTARGIFRQLASLKPVELQSLIVHTQIGPYELSPRTEHPLASDWRKAMGVNNQILPLVQKILFGEGERE